MALSYDGASKTLSLTHDALHTTTTTVSAATGLDIQRERLTIGGLEAGSLQAPYSENSYPSETMQGSFDDVRVFSNTLDDTQLYRVFSGGRYNDGSTFLFPKPQEPVEFPDWARSFNTAPSSRVQTVRAFGSTIQYTQDYQTMIDWTAGRSVSQSQISSARMPLSNLVTSGSRAYWFLLSVPTSAVAATKCEFYCTVIGIDSPTTNKQMTINSKNERWPVLFWGGYRRTAVYYYRSDIPASRHVSKQDATVGNEYRFGIQFGVDRNTRIDLAYYNVVVDPFPTIEQETGYKKQTLVFDKSQVNFFFFL